MSILRNLLPKLLILTICVFSLPTVFAASADRLYRIRRLFLTAPPSPGNLLRGGAPHTTLRGATHHAVRRHTSWCLALRTVVSGPAYHGAGRLKARCRASRATVQDGPRHGAGRPSPPPPAPSEAGRCTTPLYDGATCRIVLRSARHFSSLHLHLLRKNEKESIPPIPPFIKKEKTLLSGEKISLSV